MISQTVHQSINLQTDQSMNHLVSDSVNQSINQISQSVNQSIHHSVIPANQSSTCLKWTKRANNRPAYLCSEQFVKQHIRTGYGWIHWKTAQVHLTTNDKLLHKTTIITSTTFAGIFWLQYSFQQRWWWCRTECPRKSVDTLGTNCNQCVSVVHCCFTSTETIRLVRTESPGRPLRLSHSSWALNIPASSLRL